MTDLYEPAGGADFFVRLVDRFYDGVADDPVLRPMYPEQDLTGARHRLATFLMHYWGGDPTYMEQRGHPRLRMRHVPYVIDDAARDRWLLHMATAVEELAPTPEIASILMSYFVPAAEQLRNDFDAVVLCAGATQPRDLPVEGRNLKGVHFAMDFLTANTKSLLDSNLADGNYISAKGLDVIVIGGGDTGTDCVGTSVRHGCKSVTQLEIMPRAPDARAADNPWPEWPRVHKIDYGQEEAAAVFGRDPRDYLISTKKLVGDANGHVSAIHTVGVRWEQGTGGRMNLVEIEGTEEVLPAQLVLLAMGFTGPEKTLIDALTLATDPRGNVQADYGKYVTNLPGVFAAGDMRRGQSLIVWAINEGREAARECDRFLMGKTYLP